MTYLSSAVSVYEVMPLVPLEGWRWEVWAFLAVHKRFLVTRRLRDWWQVNYDHGEAARARLEARLHTILGG